MKNAGSIFDSNSKNESRKTRRKQLVENNSSKTTRRKQLVENTKWKTRRKQLVENTRLKTRRKATRRKVSGGKLVARTENNFRQI